ncbi:MAG: GAF and ANTAR domain-containing protein [Ornithinimicrobium sp.]
MFLVYDHPSFLHTMSGFARLLLTPYDVDATLQELAEKATEVLGLAGSGVSLMVGEHLVFGTAVPARVAALEHAQVASQEGPCVQACHIGDVVAVADLARKSDGWDAYRAVAVKHGIGAVAGVPMSLNGQVVGALNLYAEGPRDWSAQDLAAVQVLADMCTGILINASQVRQQEQLTEQLQRALNSRVVIEQAKGIVANAHEVSVDQAFERIRRYARDRNATLRSVAEAVVNLGLHV